jgi:tyrosyl-tRNA synthetase
LSLAEFRPVDEQLQIIRRGAADIIVETELVQKLERSRRSDLHLGHTVVLRKLRDFQDLGHQIIVIIGDFTGLIGDPTGRSETRKPLTREEIRANAETYRAQLGRVIDMSRTRVEFNSTWLGPLTFENIIREAASLTVARMLQREDFAARYAAERPISLHEFLYPIAQAYDSVALNADVEMGGTDQTFNLLVGRDLQRAHGQEPQIALTVPLLVGLDGVQKMSKSYGNYVGINEKPEDIFGKLMSVPDAMMWRYFELLTRIPESEIASLRVGHPMDAKKLLARTITAQYHGDGGAADAEERFARVHQHRDVPDEIETAHVTADIAGGKSLPVWLVLKEAGLVQSTSEARRMIQQGAVEVDRERVTSTERTLAPGAAYLIQVGKRRFKRVILDAPNV